MFLDFLRACLGLYINYWYCLVGVLIYSGYGVLVDGFGSCTQSPNSVRVGFQKEIWYVSEQLFRIFFLIIFTYICSEIFIFYVLFIIYYRFWLKFYFSVQIWTLAMNDCGANILNLNRYHFLCRYEPYNLCNEYYIFCFNGYWNSL